jgi:hypothetical protein
MPITKFIEPGFNFAGLAGQERIDAYNNMATSADGKDLGAKEVARFSDTATAIKRCEALASSIRARRSGLKAESEREKKPEATVAKPAPKKEPKASKPKPRKS